MPSSRVLAVQSFLDSHNCGSETEDFNTATTFVNLADQNNIDWRYEVIFYFQESTCGQHMPGYLTPSKVWISSKNPFGMMKKGGEDAGVIYYNSIDESFADEAYRLSQRPYTDKTMQAMVETYCPPRKNEPYTYWPNFISNYDQITENQQSYDLLIPMVATGELHS